MKQKVFVGVVVLAWMLISVAMTGGEVNDFLTYMAAGDGQWQYGDNLFYYPYWIVPVFSVLNALPLPVAYLAWMAVNALGLWWACRVFEVRSVWVMVNYLTLVMLTLGQIAGVVVGGLALVWWGIRKRAWPVVGVGVLLAMVKFHWALPVLAVIFLSMELDWRERARALIVPGVVFGVTLLVYGLWPVELAARILQEGPKDAGSIDLWQFAGFGVAALWVPVVVLRIALWTRMQLAIVTAPISLPYFQIYDMVALFVFNPSMAVFGNLALAVQVMAGTRAMLVAMLAVCCVWYAGILLAWRYNWQWFAFPLPQVLKAKEQGHVS